MHLNRLTLYTRRPLDMVAFYTKLFGYTALPEKSGIIELVPPGNGVSLMLHPLAKSQKEGQVLVKLGFEVPDLEPAIAELQAAGFKVSKPHQGNGYAFVNIKDPSKNTVSITTRRLSR